MRQVPGVTEFSPGDKGQKTIHGWLLVLFCFEPLTSLGNGCHSYELGPFGPGQSYRDFVEMVARSTCSSHCSVVPKTSPLGVCPGSLVAWGLNGGGS